MSRKKLLKLQHKSIETSVFMLQQSFQHQANSRKNYCRDITIRIHNQEQQNLCRNKQNMKEVNSLSLQEVEEQHKKNGDKEIIVVT